MDIPSLMTLF